MPTASVSLRHGPSEVEYHLAGTGPGVLLVHGTFGNAGPYWTPLTTRLADRYTVVSVNLAGSGATTHPDPVTVEDLAAQAAAAAAAAGLDDYHVIGHSLGAVIGAVLSARHRDRVRSLLLHAPWAVTDSRGRLQFDLWERLLGSDRHALAQLLQLTAVHMDNTGKLSDATVTDSVQGFADLVEPGHAVQLRVDRTVDIRALLPTIQAPTLVLVSLSDQIIPPTQQWAVADAIPGARTIEFDAGHALPFEDSAGFVSAVSDFLDAQPVGWSGHAGQACHQPLAVGVEDDGDDDDGAGHHGALEVRDAHQQ